MNTRPEWSQHRACRRPFPKMRGQQHPYPHVVPTEHTKQSPQPKVRTHHANTLSPKALCADWNCAGGKPGDCPCSSDALRTGMQCWTTSPNTFKDKITLPSVNARKSSTSDSFESYSPTSPVVFSPRREKVFSSA